MPISDKGNGWVEVSDPQINELLEIKARQKARKEAGTPKNVTPEMLYQAQMDILENQARHENLLRELLARR